MKKSISKKNKLLLKSLLWFVAFAWFLGSAIYLAARPVSYNMDYYGERNDEYGFFAAHRVYTRGGYVIIKTTNYDLPSFDFYYYKDGYVFTLRSETKEHCALEIDQINSRWEEALQVDFYSNEINAYRMIDVRPDGAVAIYICKQAILFTAVAVIIALVAAGVSGAYFVRFRKAKKEEQVTEE